MSELIEVLAAWDHNAWSGWMRYCFKRWHYTHPEDGSFQERWKRQMNTPYAELSEQERASDRAEAQSLIEELERHGYKIVKVGE